MIPTLLSILLMAQIVAFDFEASARKHETMFLYGVEDIRELAVVPASRNYQEAGLEAYVRQGVLTDLKRWLIDQAPTPAEARPQVEVVNGIQAWLELREASRGVGLTSVGP